MEGWTQASGQVSTTATMPAFVPAIESMVRKMLGLPSFCQLMPSELAHTACGTSWVSE